MESVPLRVLGQKGQGPLVLPPSASGCCQSDRIYCNNSVRSPMSGLFVCPGCSSSWSINTSFIGWPCPLPIISATTQTTMDRAAVATGMPAAA